MIVISSYDVVGGRDNTRLSVQKKTPGPCLLTPDRFLNVDTISCFFCVCVCVSVVIYHADHMARIVFTGRCMLLRAAAGDQDRACHTGNKFLSCEWNTCG